MRYICNLCGGDFKSNRVPRRVILGRSVCDICVKLHADRAALEVDVQAAIDFAAGIRKER